MSNFTRRQILVILVLFEIAIFLCDFTGIILLPDFTIRLTEFSLFSIIAIIGLYSLHAESKLKRNLFTAQKKCKSLEKKLTETEMEMQHIKNAANKTKTSPLIIKQMRKDEKKRA